MAPGRYGAAQGGKRLVRRSTAGDEVLQHQHKTHHNGDRHEGRGAQDTGPGAAQRHHSREKAGGESVGYCEILRLHRQRHPAAEQAGAGTGGEPAAADPGGLVMKKEEIS